MANNHWWQKAVFYELYVEKFTGNFRKLAERLDYFSALGVDCLQVLPHYPSPMKDGGYDVSDYRGVRRDLGTLADFKNFVAAVQERNIRVIIDLVLNHTSEKHPWFLEARRTKDNPKRDYYLWSESGTGFKEAVNAFPDIKKKNWIYNPGTKDYYYATFYPEQPDLNWNNPKVFSEITAIMDFWFSCGVSGFRLDAASHLVKKENSPSKSLPETHAILKRLRAYIKTKAPEAVLLAEVEDSLTEVKKYFGEGDECQLVYNFPLASKMIFAAMRGNASLIGGILNESKSIPTDAAWVAFLRNHDELSLLMLSAPERQELRAYADAQGRYGFREGRDLAMRLASIFRKEPQKIREAFRMLLALPAAAVIYYGEEIGMENKKLLFRPKDTRKYVRGDFDWREAERQMKDPDSLFSYVKKLVGERRG